MLVVLVVTFRSLWTWIGGGRPPGEDAGEDFFPTPKENERVESRRNPGFAEAGGGAGISFKDLCPNAWEWVSMEEGLVEEELRRAEDAALPLGAVE